MDGVEMLTLFPWDKMHEMNLSQERVGCRKFRKKLKKNVVVYQIKHEMISPAKVREF